MQAEPLSPALGALITGVDLARLDGHGFAELHAAFLQYQVLFFHDQPLAPEDFTALARRFGPIADYPFAKGMAEHPEITEIIKEPHQISNFGGMWHTDTAYLATPPMLTMLQAVQTPAVGGDTLFASMYAAHDALSDGMRALLAPLRGVNSSALHAAALRADHLKTGSMAQERADALTAEHPVIRLHPETGRRSLYVNSAHTERFAGWYRAESVPVLNQLFAHGVQPEFTCRFRWRPGSLAIWDNRCTWHTALNDYQGHRRVMRRISVVGDRPRGDLCKSM